MSIDEKDEKLDVEAPDVDVDVDSGNESSIDSEPAEAIANERSRINTIVRMLTIAGLSVSLALTIGTLLFYFLSRKDTRDIEYKHEGYSFSLDDLTMREKIAQLMYGSLYDSRNLGDFPDRALNHKKLTFVTAHLLDFSDWLADGFKSDENIGGVHIFRSDARNLQETNRTIIELMAKSKIPPFVSMDIVGGNTRHIGITHEEMLAYGVPAEFVSIAKKGGFDLPSQESLGKVFDSLKTVKERVDFRIKMEQYGESIARLCNDLGITINFSHVMDLIDDTEGDMHMEWNDETYGSNLRTVSILAFHYIKGFQRQNSALIGPKHFVGTGKVPGDLHKTELQKRSRMGRKDGSLLPFLDAVNGELFYRRIVRGALGSPEDFSFSLRRLLNAIKRDKDWIEANGSKESVGEEALKRLEKLEINRMLLQRLLKKFDVDPKLIDEDFDMMDPIQAIMVSHSQSFINPDIPGTLSPELGKNMLREQVGFTGIAVSDDLFMGAIQAYLESEGNGCSSSKDDRTAELFAHSFASGVTMPMLLHRSGEIDGIVKRVQRAIDTNEDFDGDGKPDITRAIIDQRVRQVLEKKRELGLLDRVNGRYVNRAKRFMKGTNAYR